MIRSSQTRNRPTSTTATTKDSNLNQIKTKMKYYEVAVKKKFSPMNMNAQPCHPEKGKIISDKIDYRMGLEKKRQELDAQRRNQSGWKKKPQDTEKQVKNIRSRKEWKALRNLSKHEYHVKSPQPPQQQRSISSATRQMLHNNQRPGTDVLSENQEKIGNVIMVRSDSRAQSASVDHTSISAVANTKLEQK